jgi:2-polyprenyl-6-methoxyphenol hydroxylase-like FAD-dependent oxidoreductase
VPAFDVVIAGAGPAGCAAAIAFARHAPAWHVCLAAPPRPFAQRLGETLPPPARTLLAHLGVWDRFRADGHDPAYRTLASWGSSLLSGNEFLLHAHQVGWRLDRARFDRMMLDAAAESATVLSSGVEAATWDGSRWTLRIGGAINHARMLIDATGRAARLARRPSSRLAPSRLAPSRLAPSRLAPSRLAQADRLVGSFVTLPNGGATRDTLVEAVPEGWWFATKLPDGRRVLGCMTDADILRQSRLGSAQGWRTALAATRFARSHWSGETITAAPRLVAAGSRGVRGNDSEAFLAVGDALCCFDPISGLGIVKALRSGVFAAYATTDWLRGDTGAIGRYQALAEREYAAYLRTLGNYYRQETRWPDAAFWKRRHGPSTRNMPHGPNQDLLAAS